MIKIIKNNYIIFILSVLILIFFGKKLIPEDGNFIGGLDVADYFYWDAIFLKNQILSGSLPLWNPYIGSGMPIETNMTFYPSTLLYILLPTPWAFNLDTFLHIFLAALGMYHFVFTISKSKTAGLVSAIVYSLSGYMMDRVYAGHITYIYSGALLPWVLFFIEKSFQKNKPLFFIIAGLILGLQILTCDGQNAFYIAFSLTIYYFFRFFYKSRPFNLKRTYLLGAQYLLIPIISFGISAIQLLPFREFVSQTTYSKLSYQSCTFFSFPIQNFFTFLIPRASTSPLGGEWEFSGYLGLMSLFLAIVGLLFSKHLRYKLIIGVISIISITIMLGNQTPIYKLYYNYVPIISSMRAPCRAIIIFVFTVAVFSGLGVQHLTALSFTKKQRVISSFILLFWIVIIFVGSVSFQIPLTSKDFIISFSFLFATIIFVFTYNFLNRKYLMTILLTLLIFIDLTIIYKSRLPIINENNLLAKKNYEQFFDKNPGYYRVILPGYEVSKRRSMAFNFYYSIGYSAAFLKDYYQFIHKMANLSLPPDFMRFTVNRNLFKSENIFSSKILNIKYAIIKNQTGYDLLEAKKVMPRAVLVRSITILPKEEHIDHIKTPDFDPENEVLLESVPIDHAPTMLNETGNRSNDTVTITKYEPNRIELSSSSDSDTFLVLSEIFYPGWHAYVDGKKLKILKANYLLRALPLSPGHHDIVFIYRPMSFIIGALISIFTLLLLIATLVFYFSRNRKEY